jgi:allophanate hydrolase
VNEHDEQLDPVKRVAAAFDRAEAAMADDPAIFLELADREGALAAVDPGAPLAGATFVVKDNIDVAGLPTTAGFAPGTRMPV